MVKTRIAYFDIAKGILILLLVFAHFWSAVHRAPFESPYFKYIYGWNNIFTCFYMPAFFVISGYCTNFKKPFGTFCLSVIKYLLIPLVSFTLIDQLIVSIVNNSSYIPTLISYFQKGGGFWFLYAMICGKCIVYGLVKFKKNPFMGGGFSWMLCILCLGVILNQYNIFNNMFFFNHGLIASFWLYIGVFFKNHSNLYEASIRYSIIVYPIVALATFFIDVSFTAYIGVTVRLIPIHLLYSITGTFFILNLCRRIEKNKVLEYWGKNSLVVYALHFTPLLLLTINLWSVFQPNNICSFIVYFIILYVLEYTICFIFMQIFEKKPFVYLLGKF